MATTFTIGAGAAAAAVGSALAAGALGLALLARGHRGGGRRKNRHHGYSRHGRSVAEEQQQIEKFLEEIRIKDVSGCGKRLVCELAAKDPELLTQEQDNILDTVG